ncbi:hypothetical protein ALC62_16008 [Cyphomyrmex costatus]|uniref:Mos1 transposase HTH domain-containing protein n=1 Tax=Cyphomyrmex costatus TaxID=456900 RepID=A0A151I646_9HYME|nr:hypothetical protein ALC62_16008 [Cyphomyrmex costatus]
MVKKRKFRRKMGIGYKDWWDRSCTRRKRAVKTTYRKWKAGKTEKLNYMEEKRKYKECLSRARVFEWFKRFQDGQEDVEGDSCPGRPSMSKTDDNIETISNLVRSDLLMIPKRTRFESVEAVKEKAARVLKQLIEEDFQHCFKQLKIRMERCRNRGGVYIEDDNK